MGCFGKKDALYASGIECVVELLDHSEFRIKLKKNSKGQTLMDEVCHHLNLFEKDYFGLRYLDQSKSAHWLNLQKGLLQQIKCFGFEGPTAKFYFRVKFYTTDPCKLKEEITRYQYFLQLKRDVVDGRIPCSFDTLVELGALVVQSECGDYDPEVHSAGYVSERRLAPQQSEEFELSVSQHHKRLAGHHPSACEFMYLDKIKWQDMYGVDLHLVKGASNSEYYIGLTPSGVVIYRQRTKVSVYYWPRIVGIKFKNKTFTLKVRDKNGTDTAYCFLFDTKQACKSLWKCCIEHHAFFRLNQVDTHDNSAVHSFFQLGSKFRYSGRTEKEMSIQEAPRSPPLVKRTPSQKQERRRPHSEINLPLNNRPNSPTHSLQPSKPMHGSRSMTNGISISHRYSYAAPPSQAIQADSLYNQGLGTGLLKSASHRDNMNFDLDNSWRSNGGLFTSGRDSPKSVRSDKMKFPSKLNRTDSGSEADSFYYNRRRSKNYDSPDEKFSEIHSLHLQMIAQQGHHKKESDNESERSAARRRRRRQRRAGQDSGSDADSIQHRPNGSMQYSESMREDSVCSDLSTPTPRSRCRRHSRGSKCHHRHKPDDLVNYLNCKLAEVKELSSQRPNNLSRELEVPDGCISPSQLYGDVVPNNDAKPSVVVHNNLNIHRNSIDEDKLTPIRRRQSGSYENISYENGSMQIIPENGTAVKNIIDVTSEPERLISSHKHRLDEMKKLTEQISILADCRTPSPIKHHPPRPAAQSDNQMVSPKPVYHVADQTSTPKIIETRKLTQSTRNNLSHLQFYNQKDHTSKQLSAATPKRNNMKQNGHLSREKFILNNHNTLKVSNI